MDTSAISSRFSSAPKIFQDGGGERVLLKEGPLLRKASFKKVARYCFLFSDVFLVSNPLDKDIEAGQLEVKQVIDLQTTTLVEVDNSTFTLKAIDRDFVFTPPNADDRDVWVAMLGSAIDAAKDGIGLKPSQLYRTRGITVAEPVAGLAVSQQSTSIDPSAFVLEENTVLDGVVSVGPGSVVHPFVTLRGHVRIGANVLIEELSVVEGGEAGNELVIGDGTHLRSACLVQGSVGEHSVIGARGVVAQGARVGTGCSVGDRCVVWEGKVLDDDSALWSAHAPPRRLNGCGARDNKTTTSKLRELQTAVIDPSRLRR